MVCGWIARLTAATVLWHAVTGCCLHHGHGLTLLPTASARSLSRTGCQCGDATALTAKLEAGRHMADTCTDHPHAPHGCPGGDPTECTEVRCVFPNPESPVAAPALAEGWAPSLLSDVAAIENLRHAWAVRPSFRRPAASLALGLRPHLALHVLQI
jgi:hypothetical protein